ncbi:MAG: CPBP family intramembrane metalloprotease [Rhodothermia bacterium]|nr:CPBP family intramembrane metalloprotease [Rhodothermia bacterium]
MTDYHSENGSTLLVDPWQSAPIELNGRLERAGFPPWLTAILVLFVALILFQVVIAPIATIGLLLGSGTPVNELLPALATLATEHTKLLLIANTIGQVFALAIPTMLIALLHTRQVSPFLRLQGVDVKLLLLSVAGLAGFFPVVQWLGEINSTLPVPEFIREFEKLMLEPIERLLKEPGMLGFNIAMIALTPAICEEILFRGYVQRQAERSMGVTWGIVFTGLVFGAYHLQITKFLPLAALGIFLGYLTWRTGSLIPAMVVHLANNAIAILIGTYAANSENISLEDLENLSLPWYFVVAGMAIFVSAVYLMNRLANLELAERAQSETDPQAELPGAGP